MVKDLTDVKWRVLGVEDGNLLIMSTSSVGEVTLGEKDDLELSQNDYVTGIDKLNELASNYSKGKNAISARSVTMEDINKITNYDYTKFLVAILENMEIKLHTIGTEKQTHILKVKME